MPMILIILTAFLQGVPSTTQVQHVLATSDIVKVGSIAARDEGYTVGLDGTFLDEMRSQDGKPLYPGYASIALYHGGHPVRFYSIRIDTGDVVDGTACEILRYRDLLKFRAEVMKTFGTKPVSAATIAAEIGCGALKIVPAGKRPR